MKNLKASDVMVRPVVAAKKNAPARDVVFQFLNGFYSGMPVTDDEGQVIGIITELDILDAVLAGKELVENYRQGCHDDQTGNDRCEHGLDGGG